MVYATIMQKNRGFQDAVRGLDEILQLQKGKDGFYSYLFYYEVGE